jgi:single-strand DNA-binding protein
MNNQVQLIGHVGKTPEITTASNGNKYAKFSLATTEKYVNKAGEKIEDTVWHNITLWGTQATLAEKYISKGSQIGIQAKLTNNNYTNKQGVNVSTYELKVMDVMLLGNNKA